MTPPTAINRLRRWVGPSHAKRVLERVAVLAVVACAVCCAGPLVAFLASTSGLMTLAVALIAAGVVFAMVSSRRHAAAPAEKLDKTVDAS